MSTYKVGDLASLFPSPPQNGKGKKLQALFNQQNKKNKQFQNKNKKYQHIQEKPEFNISKKVAAKRKFVETEVTDGNKLNSEKIPVETTFKRSSKKQRKIVQALPFSDFSPQEDNLFVVDSTPEEKQLHKKQKKKSIKYDKQFSVSDEDGNNCHVTNVSPKKVKRDKKISVTSIGDECEEKPKGASKILNEEADIKNTKSQKKSFDLEAMKAEKNKDLATTLFVGNLPLSSTKKVLQDKFQRFGPLKNIRLRGAIPAKDKMPKKVAEIKNKYHDCMQSLKAYVVFKDRKCAEDALFLNGSVLDGHHIVVDFATQPGEKRLYDNNLSIFIGNLPFNVMDDSVWSTFETCGEVTAVRIIRDRQTGIGKGFGYVQFKSVDAKKEALLMEEVEIEGRQIRIKSVSNTPPRQTAKESFKMIRSNVAMTRRSLESGNKKSVKKLLKKGRRLHHNKQTALKLGQKWKK